MFSNIGGKIKAAAKIACWILIGLSVVWGITLMVSGQGLMGFVMIVACSLAAWVGSFTLYGFGELIENSCIQTNLMIKWDKEKKND